MTIAFVLPSFAGGGAERVLLTLLAGLDRSRFAPQLTVIDGRGPLARMVPADVPIHDLGTARLRNALPGLVATLRRLKPNSVVSSFGYVNLALIALRQMLPRETRLIVREANLPSLSLANARYSSVMAFGYRHLYRHADAVIASSARMADELTADLGVPTEKLRVLPNPVDVEGIRAAAAEPAREPGAGPRFVAAGRLTHQKGFDRLIDLLGASNPNLHVTIFGDGPDRAALAERIVRLQIENRVTLCGFEPSPWPWYAAADGFLLPSRWEGMPNAALEALACGTPIIATHEAGGIAEVADAAPRGAIRVVPFGDRFLAAMSGAAPNGMPARPRPSLLPHAFESAAVCRRFEGILDPSS